MISLYDTIYTFVYIFPSRQIPTYQTTEKRGPLSLHFEILLCFECCMLKDSNIRTRVLNVA